MKIEVTIKYYVPFIPYRCRKPRYNEVEETVKVNVREVSMSDVQLAFEVDYAVYNKVFLYKNKCYIEQKYKPGYWSNENISNSLEELIWRSKNCSTYYANRKVWDYRIPDDKSQYESREEIIKRIKDDFKQHIIIDGVLYVCVGYPIYHIVTFGCGNNHGSTDLMPTFLFSPKKAIKRNINYYSPYDYEIAKNKATEIATNRKDTDSIKLGFRQSITCHLDLSHKYKRA